MASLSFARPGKVSERQYVGDLAGLFERHRRRAGIALTRQSFAADLAECDALRSALFTLCTAISHMGEDDLSPAELLDLVAQALDDPGSDMGSAEGPSIPAGMQEAFLPGYAAWQNRDMHPIPMNGRVENWPSPATLERKPSQRNTASDAIAQEAVAASGGSPEPPSLPGHRTVQEALGLARGEQASAPKQFGAQSAFPGRSEADTSGLTLGEIKDFLEEIEHRVSRLGPHIQQLKSVAREPAPRERPAPLPDGVIPFPTRRGRTVDDLDGLSDFERESFVPRHPASALRAEEASASKKTETDDRPPGIDALVAAAPAWASATPTARSFDEEAFLSRHAYLSPAPRPSAVASASVYYVEPVAQPPATVALPAKPTVALIEASPISAAPAFALPTSPRIGLDVEGDPLLSPMERLQAYMLRLPPRRVFLALASLTILAGGLAGLMAYRTLHTGHVPQFKDIEPTVPFGVAPPSSMLPAAASAAIASQPSPPAAAAVIAPEAIAPAPKPAASAVSRAGPHTLPAHQPPVAVWPPVPQQIATPAPATAPLVPSAHTAAPQALPSGPPYVSPSAMIGYALATPQPANPAGRAHGIAGTVAVEITVSRLGDVTSAHAVSGPQELRSAALVAVRGWRFRPYLVDGRPIEVSTTLRFLFKGN